MSSSGAIGRLICDQAKALYMFISGARNEHRLLVLQIDIVNNILYTSTYSELFKKVMKSMSFVVKNVET